MRINATTGEIDMEEGGLIIRPDTNRNEFLASPMGASAHFDFANHQYATYSFTFSIDSVLIGLSIIFESQKIASLRLEKIDPGQKWANWSKAHELERKNDHDRLLYSLLGKPPYKFAWGEAISEYDSRSGSANINIRYKKS